MLLRLRSVELCDISGIHMLENIVRAYRERRGDVFMMRVQEPVLHMMQRTGFLDYLGADHILSEDDAIEHLFYKVLDPAICIYESNVRVFKECQNLPRPDYPITLSLDVDLKLGQVADLTPDQLWQQLHDDLPPMVIDVREPREFQRGHIPRAELMPLTDILTSTPALPDARLIVFVCRSGRRSERVACLFQQKGYAHVAVLRGGMLAWEAAGLLEAVT